MLLIHIILSILFIYLSVCVIYAFIFSLAGALGKIKKSPSSENYKKFAVLIPCYKDDFVILKTAADALKQTYPKAFYDVVVIADALKPETIIALKKLPLKVLEVSFELSTKAKSLNEAFRQLPEAYDYALILDADNLMAPDFIYKLNAVMDKTGAKAIQGHRVAANLNTNFAILDAVSEEVNNHIYRKGHRVLGLSSGLIGSGMAFDYSYFKNLMAGNKAIGGFDKESELKILRDKIRIEYAEDALVFDEKVENPEVFGNQRRRWISAQLHYFKKYFLSGFYHLFTRGNIDFFDKAFQQFLLPRAMVLAMVFLMAGVAFVSEYIFDWLFYPGFIFWFFIMLLNCIGLMLAIPGRFYNKKTLKAVSQLPKAILIMFLTIFRLKGANKKFIHTPHSGHIDINP